MTHPLTQFLTFTLVVLVFTYISAVNKYNDAIGRVQSSAPSSAPPALPDSLQSSSPLSQIVLTHPNRGFIPNNEISDAINVTQYTVFDKILFKTSTPPLIIRFPTQQVMASWILSSGGSASIPNGSTYHYTIISLNSQNNSGNISFQDLTSQLAITFPNSSGNPVGGVTRGPFGVTLRIVLLSPTTVEYTIFDNSLNGNFRQI